MLMDSFQKELPFELFLIYLQAKKVYYEYKPGNNTYYR